MAGLIATVIISLMLIWGEISYNAQDLKGEGVDLTIWLGDHDVALKETTKKDILSLVQDTSSSTDVMLKDVCQVLDDKKINWDCVRVTVYRESDSVIREETSQNYPLKSWFLYVFIGTIVFGIIYGICYVSQETYDDHDIYCPAHKPIRVAPGLHDEF